jgi:hypothetical protein
MKTLAIVVGNNKYYAGTELTYAVADATAMADVFQRLGYDVIPKYDITSADCDDLMREIDSRIADYEATIFYFAGHGFEVEGHNFLASIECQIATPDIYHCKRTCIVLSELLDKYKKNPGKMNIVIIDACRRAFERGTSPNFTSVQAPKGTLIAFSTSPNDGAKDGGFGQHSIYTGALLKYIGRERLSVEELFKRVRKTVFTISDGKQTTWEHTSLIGDFFFNTGQLVYSVQLPYEELVIKDHAFDVSKDAFSQLIGELKSYNWGRQNPAIDKLLGMPPQDLDKNKQFIIGRNLLQASGYAFHASNFFERLPTKLERFTSNEENHLLNGILFEIYFDSYGQFRRHIKNQSFEEVMALRSHPSFVKSFEFIRNALSPHADILHWIPGTTDSIIDVDVRATAEKITRRFGPEELYDVISKINVHGKDLTEAIGDGFGIIGRDREALKNALANFLSAPKSLIQINSNLELRKIAFVEPAVKVSEY